MSDKATLADLKIDRSDDGGASRAWLWFFGLAVLVGLGVAAYFFAGPRARAVVVGVARISDTGGSATVLNASGYVTARRRATVSSKVTAKVLDVLIEEGMAVKEGQVLARLDDSNVGASFRLAEAELRTARTSLEETRVQLAESKLRLRRTRALLVEGVVSQAELDRVQAATDSMEARLERQRQEEAVADRRVGVWKQQLEDTMIRAPFDGIVTTKDAQPGEMISPVSAGGGFTRTGIGTVVDMSSLEVEVDVNESYINRVRSDQEVEAVLDAYPEWKIPCHVIAIVPTADRDRATVRVRIGFEALDSRILPDMGVKVAFRDDRQEKEARRLVAISRKAIREDSGRDIVFVVTGESVERRTVNVVSVEGDEALIVAGLDDGERVVVDGPEDLTDGDRVEVTSR